MRLVVLPLANPPDDTSIPDDDALFRRLPNLGKDFWLVDLATGESRPASGAFMPDPDGLSVYRRDILYQNELSAADVTLEAANAVVSLGVGDVRALHVTVDNERQPAGLTVHNDPWPADSDGHIRDVAHTLVKGIDAVGGKKVQLRCRQALAKLPSLRLVYPAS